MGPKGSDFGSAGGGGRWYTLLSLFTSSQMLYACRGQLPAQHTHTPLPNPIPPLRHPSPTLTLALAPAPGPHPSPAHFRTA